MPASKAYSTTAAAAISMAVRIKGTGFPVAKQVIVQLSPTPK